MKQPTLLIVALGAVLTLSGFAAESKSSSPTLPPATKQIKLFKIATINGAQANREFQTNVQLMQNERQAVIELNNAFENEKDAAKKKELKTKLDAALAKLNSDNAKMEKAYGFSIVRNYVMEIETANIYLQVTDEEAAKLEAEQKEQQKAKK
jgi:hypothetical protein